MSCAVMAGCSDSSSSSSSKADSSTSKAETSAAAGESTASEAGTAKISRILSQRSIQRRYRARALLST